VNVFLYVIAALFGLIIGSFLNVLILRKSLRKSIGGRSHCRGCKKTLSPVELVPIVSFLIQKGRCRSCGIALLWQYPLVELATAILFVISFILVNPSFFDVYSWLILFGVWIGVAVGVVIIVFDLRYTIIPDYAVIALLILGVIASIMKSGNIQNFPFSNNSLIPTWLAAFIISGFFAALWLFSKGRWMGLGDAKLILSTSVLLGFPASLVAFLFSFWLGALVSFLLILCGKKSLTSKLPFGPFIVFASVLSYFLIPHMNCAEYAFFCLFT